MTQGEWLTAATKELNQAGISTAHLDALVLLEDRLNVNRAWLLAHSDELLKVHDKNVLSAQIKRRSLHEPLAYIRGKTEFYGRDFKISTGVLEPRPESETMIDLLKSLYEMETRDFKEASRTAHPTNTALPNPLVPLHARIADVGTGSGALGISAQLELPNTSVDLLEIDETARQVAKSNVVFHTIDIPVIKTDLLVGSPENYDILLCNLPYVPDDFQINTAATHEPKIAIFGGPDGLNIYRKLFGNIHNLQHKPLYILTEALPTQHETLAQIARENHYKLSQVDDFIQAFKYNF